MIITMGEQGAVYMSKKSKDMCTHVPASDVPHLADPSGAGDAFMGSLAYHIARFPKLSTEHHISAAHSCAAYSMAAAALSQVFRARKAPKVTYAIRRPRLVSFHLLVRNMKMIIW